jgi:hypothetical protein
LNSCACGEPNALACSRAPPVDEAVDASLLGVKGSCRRRVMAACNVQQRPQRDPCTLALMRGCADARGPGARNQRVGGTPGRSPRAIAFRERDRPELAVGRLLLAFEFAQSRASGCGGPRDYLCPPAASRRAIALATRHSSGSGADEPAVDASSRPVPSVAAVAPGKAVDPGRRGDLHRHCLASERRRLRPGFGELRAPDGSPRRARRGRFCPRAVTRRAGSGLQISAPPMESDSLDLVAALATMQKRW